MNDQLLIGIQTGKWFDKSKPIESMRLAKELGIEAIDYGFEYIFRPNEFVKGTKYPIVELPETEFIETFSLLKQASEENGVKIAQIHAHFPVYFEDNPTVNDYCIKVLEKMLGASAYLNCKQFVVHPHQDAWQPHQNQKWVKQNIEMYSKLIKKAKECGVTVCLENLQCEENDQIVGGICSSADETIYLIDTLNQIAGEKVFGFCLDVGHANACGVNIYDFIKKVGDRITALHIHDNDGKSDAHLIPYTQVKDQWGVDLGLDWEGFIKGLKEINYLGCLSFETFRAFHHLPREVWKEGLILNVAIGKYFRKRILE
ncbi:MAG: sugar phosphate isomerase/epimerase [Clostridia bacterium]|nr:sugar phosphate isomerase/epimerase [Clostridia bacterium]